MRNRDERRPPLGETLTSWRVIGGVALAVLVVVAIVVTVSSGGSNSSPTNSPVAARSTAPTTSASTPDTASTAAHAGHHPKAKHPQSAHPTKKTSPAAHTAKTKSKHKSSSSTSTSTSSTPTSSSSTPTSTSSTPTSSSPTPTTGSTGNGSGSKKKTSSGGSPATPKPAPLPSPVVSASRAGVHVSFHGPNHSPTAGRKWHYSVLATDASGNALSGTVNTVFVFNGTVVGREHPLTQRLKDGRLKDFLNFPARAIGIPLLVRVLVHTPAGTVTLNWSVKVQR